MAGDLRTFMLDRVPGYRRLVRLPKQLLHRSPFEGDIEPTRVPIFAPMSGRPSLPFPHPWNYRDPIRILSTYFWKADEQDGSGRHNRYLDFPGTAPVFVTRDPGLIQSISKATGAGEGQFDRDTLPSTGIARATGADTLLYANGPMWKLQKKLSTPPFARTTLFQPEQFMMFANTFAQTVQRRMTVLTERLGSATSLQVELEPEVKAIMLEMLVNNFFGADVPYDVIRDRYVVGLDRVIEHIVGDTVINRLGIPLEVMPPITGRIRQAKAARAVFEELTSLVLSTRADGKGLWGQFKSDAPDDALRSNIRVFLAGALEATTSYACWAIAHLARNTAAQDALYAEVAAIDDYTPQALKGATYLASVLDETLRLTPSLYFHPRRATADTWVETPDGARLRIPYGTHILLDIWHANRHDDHWGVDQTGFAAADFAPERWPEIARRAEAATGTPKRHLHFGFGHGPRFCPGKNLGQLEVALVVGAFTKLFRYKAIHEANEARAGVSTKPADGVLIDLELRS